MKVTRMSPVHAANLVANSGNTAYGVDVIGPPSLSTIQSVVVLWWFVCKCMESAQSGLIIGQETVGIQGSIMKS